MTTLNPLQIIYLNIDEIHAENVIYLPEENRINQEFNKLKKNCKNLIITTFEKTVFIVLKFLNFLIIDKTFIYKYAIILLFLISGSIMINVSKDKIHNVHHHKQCSHTSYDEQNDVNCIHEYTICVPNNLCVEYGFGILFVVTSCIILLIVTSCICMDHLNN